MKKNPDDIKMEEKGVNDEEKKLAGGEEIENGYENRTRHHENLFATI